MAKIVQCVPNFSEGRRREVIRKILDQIKKVPDVNLLDYSSNESHNRTVVTFVGEPECVLEAAFLAAKKAAELINMEDYRGEHPSIGATDVIPFVPVSGVTMAECTELARRLGQRMGEELKIPIYLYEAAATRPDRQNLVNVRKGQYEGLKHDIKEAEWQPDFGPAVMPRAGATAVGARPPLIGLNINLDTQDVTIAKNIAKAIRGSSGGFPSIKAFGVMIDERHTAQVTINVCNYKEVPLHRVFEMVKSEASRYGVNILGSEIIGLTPLDALVDAAEFYLRLENFHRPQILENRISE